MPRRRPLGSAPSLHHALLCILVIVPFIAAAQQQQPSNNVFRRSPPEDAVLDPSNRQRQLKGPRISTAHSHRNGKHTAIIPNNERALATFAPAESDSTVRAHPAIPSVATAGLSSRHPARSLQDWQVEDIILLATVDGKIHARERYSGIARWELEVDRPMVETVYHRNNKSNPQAIPGEDDLLWIVEPSQDGALYVYAPDARLGMQKLGLTVKQLVEELSPYAGEDPAVVYTADKKNTLYTVDAANGNILKTFSSSGSFNNDDRSCRKANALESLDEKECEPIGTLTLGRTEYTVAIQDKNTGDPICTISYFEWGPNIRDKDLHSQYTSTLDNRYVYSKYDGSVMALEQLARKKKGRQVASEQSLMYSHKFSSPVVRVYDVIRPFDSGDDTQDTPLAILPQPAGPVGDEFPDLDHVFVNQTEGGSWYALSEQTYPLVTAGASRANIYNEETYHGSVSYGNGFLAKQRASMVGVHPLSLVRNDRQNIPTISGPEDRKTVDMPSDRLEDSVSSLIESSSKPWTNTLPSPLTLILILLLGCAAMAPTQKQWLKKHKLFRFLDPQQDVVSIDMSQDAKVPLPALVTEDVATPTPTTDRKVRFPEPAEETIFPQDTEIGEEATVDLKTETRDEKDEKDEPSADDSPNEAQASRDEPKPMDSPQQETTPKPEKKARRGVRGGRQAKQKRLEAEQAQQRKRSNSQVSPSKRTETSTEVAKIVEEVKSIQPNGSEVISVDASESPTVSGKIQINSLMIDTDRVIGHGSAGTCVFEGSFEGRHVAVKRMLSQYYELASSEVSFLQQSDDHENVIRYFCQQKDQHFLYIAVELCQASLWDLYYSDTRDDVRRQQLGALLSAIQQDIPKALYQLAAGLRHLHKRRIIHRDIKPQNILLAFPKRFETNKGPRLVISDFGLCKTLPENVSTLIDPTNNAGTCGWKAPELISQPKDTLSNNSNSIHSQSSAVDTANGATGGIKRAADIFSLGCLFFWVLTGGCHPYDDKEGWMQMRELNIKKNNLQNMHKLDLGSDTEEPMQLIGWMLSHRPEDRPNASDVLAHPFFWKAETRLAFLCDVSDHFERESRDPPSVHLEILESWSEIVIDRGDFLRKLDRSFIDTLGKQRKYTGSRMLDLLRAMRNKKNHYEDMPEDVKKRVGALPAGYLQYWTARFPKLLMACYDIVHQCRIERNDRFKGYFGDVE